MPYAISNGNLKTNLCEDKLCEDELTEVYSRASQFVVDCGFEDEIEWQRSRQLEQMTETQFLSEAAWVVLSSGMRETVIRSKFPSISKSFHHWESADEIHQNAKVCREQALTYFGHSGKISAILTIVEHVAETGIDSVKEELASSGVSFISNFPYMGPATSYHLAKNLGLDVAKPDRHLIRITEAAGYDSPDSLCRTIADYTGESIAVIDVILWRYATLRDDYIDTFSIYSPPNN